MAVFSDIFWVESRKDTPDKLSESRHLGFSPKNPYRHADCRVHNRLIAGLIAGMNVRLVVALPIGIIVGLVAGLIAGLMFGGVACVQHVTLRIFLWKLGYAPLNYARFLDYCHECIFLRKVGGGYIFIHRMLMEHFAAMTEEDIERIAGSVD